MAGFYSKGIENALRAITGEEIRDLFSKRDQDSGRRIKGTIPNVFKARTRGKRY